MAEYSETLFQTARDRILKVILDKNISEVEDTVLGIVEELDGRGPSEKAFDQWSIEELLRAQGRLSLLRVNLGIASARAIAQANHIAKWKIYQNAKEWNPTKTRLEEEFAQLNKKLLKGDIEAILVEAFWETTQKEVFKQELADRLKSLFDATNQVLTAIKMQVNQKTQERYQTTGPDNTGD